MIDLKNQPCPYLFYASYGDIRRWGRYEKKSKLRKILRDLKNQ